MLMDELLEREHEGWRSLCDSTGGEVYGRIMTDDGLMVLVDGSVLDRDAVAASLTDVPPWRAYEITQPHVLSLTETAASLVYVGSARREGAELLARMVSTYSRIDGAWRLALYQQTLLQ